MKFSKDTIISTFLKLLFIFLTLLIILYLIRPQVPCNIPLAKKSKTEIDIALLLTTLKLFKIDVGRYPSSKEGLQALIYCPNDIDKNIWKGPYFVEKNIPSDPWGNDYNYAFNIVTDSVFLYSYGQDGISKSEGNDVDDINSWDETRKWEKYYNKNSIDKVFLTLLIMIIVNAYLLWKRRMPKTKS